MFFTAYKLYISHKLSHFNMYKRVSSNLINYLFSEIAWNMDCLIRFESSKTVKAVDAHHHVLPQQQQGNLLQEKLQQKDCYPKINGNLVGDFITLYPWMNF